MDDLYNAQVERVTLSGLSHRLLYWPGPEDQPAILMLHGWLDQAASLAEMASKLREQGPVLALDFRGHGHSEWIGHGGYYHFFDYLRDVSELLEDPRLAKAPVRLIGHSMGGAVATLVAGALPDKIERLALLEGSGPPAHPAKVALRRSQNWLSDLRRFGKGPKFFESREGMESRLVALYPEFEPELLSRFVQQAVLHEEGKGWRWRYDPMHRCTNPSPFQQEIYTAFAGAYPGPVLQIYGEQSPLARRQDPQVLAREAAFTGPRRVIGIPQARHMMHLTHAQACVEVIVPWLQTSAETSAP